MASKMKYWDWVAARNHGQEFWANSSDYFDMMHRKHKEEPPSEYINALHELLSGDSVKQILTDQEYYIFQMLFLSSASRDTVKMVRATLGIDTTGLRALKKSVKQKLQNEIKKMVEV